jgi:hypothetical protein
MNFCLFWLRVFQRNLSFPVSIKKLFSSNFKKMKNILISTLLVFLLVQTIHAQNDENPQARGNVAIAFEPGLLIGNPQGIYPLPFSTHVSVLAVSKSGFFTGGIGSGAEIFGKTFLPLFADIRITPLKSKPLFFFSKCGFSFCANQSDNSSYNSDQNYYYSYLPQPHYLYHNNETKGGFLFESGLGVFINRPGFKTTVSFGYRHQQTFDVLTQQNATKKTFENRFNRVVFRIGFWF